MNVRLTIGARKWRLGSLAGMPATDLDLADLADLAAAKAALDLASDLAARAAMNLAALSEGGRRLDEHQVLAYDLAHATAGVETARAALRYGDRGDIEARLASVFVADVVADLVARTAGRESEWGTEPGWHHEAVKFLAVARSAEALASVAETPGPLHLDPDFELVRETFRRYADDQIAPRAEHIHRQNADIPEEIIRGLADMGGFGLSVPEQYGGFASGGEHDYLGMVVATEELLPRFARRRRGSHHPPGDPHSRHRERGHRRAAPSTPASHRNRRADGRGRRDGARLRVGRRQPDRLGHAGRRWRLPGERCEDVVHFRCPGRRAHAPRATDPDRSKGHRGLSLFVVPKPQTDSHGFVLTQDDSAEGRPAGLGQGKLEGRPIDTLGYRGMHSYELAFDNWWVASENLIGGEEGKGKGFYLQMAGFENGRLQTAARALGVMQAAYESALSYARARKVFGQPIIEYQLTRAKIGRMAAMIQASRQFSYEVASMMARGEGSMEASMVKAYVCRAAEWVSREAMQIHGGMGYAEEFPVSRLFVDARVLSIFEGADETLCLKVIARRLAEQASR